MDIADLAMKSTVLRIIDVYPLLSQPSIILFIVVVSDFIFILKALTFLSFGLSRLPTVQSILFMPPANYITKTHGIIIWFYNPSLKFNCFIWLHKAIAEIQSFKSLAFFHECLFPRYQLRYIRMFYHQRDKSNCLDDTNCIIKAGIFGSIEHFLWQTMKNKWIKKSTCGVWTPNRKKSLWKKINITSN